ncbi:MAG: bifunctional oligoribonuclease/PAP phosphatase NrnA [Bdellovibrionales bacterium]|nr:bifunctional oligoribonuclease/PAP phosphatase NrnA [Bdellovibrionales bacterium]
MSDIPRLNKFDVQKISQKIEDAETIVLSTHRQCDGDGLGACLGLYHALKKIGKKVQLVCVDAIPSKYKFLNTDSFVEVFEEGPCEVQKSDLALIFDTNDYRQVSPLYEELQKQCGRVLFVDHHPVLQQGPDPTEGSFIETQAASTGEIAYFIIKTLGIRLDKNIARALYTSIAFDTQIFRYVKSSSNSHLIASELLIYEHEGEDIHRMLFSTYTPNKIAYLSKVLGEVEFYNNSSVAILRLKLSDLENHGLEMDDARDVIDMIMNIKELQAAALFREDQTSVYKLSLRSKGSMEVLSIAEHFGGGGHLFAAGALIQGEYRKIRDEVLQQIQQRLLQSEKAI